MKPMIISTITLHSFPGNFYKTFHYFRSINNTFNSGVNALYVVIEEFVNLYAEDVSNLFLSDKETRVSDMTVVFQIYARIRYLFETWRNYSTAYVTLFDN